MSRHLHTGGSIDKETNQLPNHCPKVRSTAIGRAWYRVHRHDYQLRHWDLHGDGNAWHHFVISARHRLCCSSLLSGGSRMCLHLQQEQTDLVDCKHSIHVHVSNARKKPQGSKPPTNATKAAQRGQKRATDLSVCQSDISAMGVCRSLAYIRAC